MHPRNPYLHDLATRLSDRLERTVEAFEEAWHKNLSPNLADFLNEAGAERQALLVELIHADLEFRIKAGESARVESYLEAYPELRNERDIVVELLVRELVLRNNANPSTNLDEIGHRFGELASAVAERLIRHFETQAYDDPTGEYERGKGNANSIFSGDSLPAIPGYKLHGVLGRGGMGVVYKAEHLQLRRLVALKMVRDDKGDPDSLIRFRAEALAVAQLHHPSIVQIYEVGEFEGQPFLSLEYVEGGSLANNLGGKPMLNLQAAKLLESIAQAMHAAHQHGIVHRDLKPANVLLTAAGTPKISDFGLAKKQDDDSAQTRTGMILGTPSYMAPEQASGLSHEIGPCADVWALGAMLYEMLTGRPPFRGPTTLETLEQVRSKEPVSPRQLQPGVARDLETICLKCLNKDSKRRYPSALELAEDLARFQAGLPIRARPIGTLERGWRWCRRNPALAGMTGLALVALLAVLTLFGIGQERDRRARDQALAHAAREEKLRRHAEHDAARMLLEQSLAKCRLEDAAIGVHWLGKSLQKAIDAEAPDLEAEIREQLALWRQELHPLEDVLSLPGRVQVVTFSPDGKWLATRTREGIVQVWETSTWKCCGRIDAKTLSRRGIAFDPTSTRLAVARAEAIFFHEVPRLKRTETVLLHEKEDGVLALAFSRDGKKLASAGAGGWVRLWNAQTGEPLTPGLLRHDGPVEALTLNHDGTMLISCTDQHPVCKLFRWETSTGNLLGIENTEYMDRGLSFHPAGARFLAGSLDQTVRQRDFRQGHQAGPEIRLPRGVYDAAYSPDGFSIVSASADKTVRLWDQARGNQRGPSLKHQDVAYTVAFSPDGSLLASGSLDQTVRIWRLGGWSPRKTISLGRQMNVQQLGLLSDGATLMAGADVGDPTHRALLCHLETGAIRTVGEFAQSWTSPHFAFGNESVICLTPSNAAYFEVPSGRQLPLPIDPKLLKTPLSIRKDGKVLACGNGKGIQLWDLASGQAIGLPLEHAEVFCVAFSADGGKLLTGGFDHAARLWEVSTGRLLHTWRHADKIVAATFSPDGKLALTGGNDEAARLWDVASGLPAGKPLLHVGQVQAVAFSADGRFILTGNQNRHAALWDLASRRQLGPNLSHPESVGSVAFLPGGKQFITGCYDGKIRLYDLAEPFQGEADAIQIRLEAATGQELTPDGSFRVLDAKEWHGRKVNAGS